MGLKRGGVQAARVREVREQIALWRGTREKRTAMPADLWAEAVGLARKGGTYATARALGVGLESLARRVAEAGAGAGAKGGSARGSAFMELSGAQLLGAAVATGSVVEISDGDGARLTIRLAGDTPLDVVGVVQGFCRRGA
jgi:hypothetical protein